MQLSKAAIQALALGAMEQHGLIGWSFGFDNHKVRAGACYYFKKLITLSKHFVERNPLSEVTDTILHEIAHALAGHQAGHGPLWRQVCCRIGAKPVACYDTTVVDMPKGAYRAVCPGCKREFRKHRRPKRTRFCRNCGIDRGTLTFLKLDRDEQRVIDGRLP